MMAAAPLKIVLCTVLCIHVLVLPTSVSGQKITWFSASDTHLGHDVGNTTTNITTSYEKNVWVINEMNTIANNASWPSSLGGGIVGIPLGVTVSGDLIDAALADGDEVNSCNQWMNFTALYGLNGTDGLLKYKVYEGRGNHDGSPTETTPPPHCEVSQSPSRNVAARNRVRLQDPSFQLNNISIPTSLHYSWTWNITDTCRIHFVHQNLFPGHACGSSDNPGREGKNPGFNCSQSNWTDPENSLGFLEDDLELYGNEAGTLIVTIFHYSTDPWSLSWFNQGQQIELWTTLLKYNTLAVLTGHTHSATLASFNGTTQGEWNSKEPGFINVITAPATQKEDGYHNALPSEFMVIDAGFATSEDAAAGTGILRVAQRVGSSWGTVIGTAPFQC